jgi:hypothetical protein
MDRCSAADYRRNLKRTVTMGDPIHEKHNKIPKVSQQRNNSEKVKKLDRSTIIQPFGCIVERWSNPAAPPHRYPGFSYLHLRIMFWMGRLVAKKYHLSAAA